MSHDDRNEEHERLRSAWEDLQRRSAPLSKDKETNYSDMHRDRHMDKKSSVFKAFSDELEKIADPSLPSPSRPPPINVSARGPSVPHPGGLKPVKLAGVASGISKLIGEGTAVGRHLDKYQHAYDLGGLGILAAPAVDNLAHQASNKIQGKKTDGREAAHAGLELAGLGTLAAPVAAAALRKTHVG